MTLKSTLYKYYWLTKPGIVYGNALPTIAGFSLAAGKHWDFWLFLAVLVGQSLIIACGCVLNNIQDRGIDKQMKRTSWRALATGDVSIPAALVYATILGLAGSALLLIFVNTLTFFVGLTGLVVYVVLYGYTKRRGPYGTLVGSVSGAMPPVAGYTAVTGSLDGAALILFLILVTWQMPHFYAIALRRKADYAAAGIPVLSVRRGAYTTKVHILYYIVAFFAATYALFSYGYAGVIYVVVSSALSIIWLYKGIHGFKTTDDTAWAKNMFLFSLIVLLGTCAAIALAPWLP